MLIAPIFMLISLFLMLGVRRGEAIQPSFVRVNLSDD